MKINLCVTCVGGALAFDTLRAFRTTPGVEPWILGVDGNAGAPGRLLCDAFEVVPSAGESADLWVSKMSSVLDAHKIDVLVALSDAECRAVARVRDEWSKRGISTSVSSAETVATVTDKLDLLAGLEAGGVYVGPYRRVDGSADLHRALVDLGYPREKVVLKPRRASGSRGVLIFDAGATDFRSLLDGRFCGTGDYNALSIELERHPASLQNAIAVPYYEGPVYDVDCVAREGVLVDACARLRQLRNPLSPTSTGHRITKRPDIIEHAREMVSVLGIDGAGDFDVIVSNGRPMVIDAGVRLSGSVGGALAAGLNFPAQLLRSLVGLEVVEQELVREVIVRPFLTLAEIPPANEADFL